jgi:aspartokinase/homoserine dehydrogenase 1
MSILKSEEKEIKYKGIKELSVLDNVSLVNLEGKGLLGKAGIDARIFRVMATNKISVSIISQGSSIQIELLKLCKVWKKNFQKNCFLVM